MFLEPTKIRSPYTGETVMPKITTHTTDGKKSRKKSGSKGRNKELFTD